ncbi:MAG TPA: hypothetical protein VF669_02460 [Tepidisphaeraceae bacterium]|jgi:hypothetical protein
MRLPHIFPFLTLLWTCATLRAGLPFFTDDPGLPSRGTWELNFFSLYQKTADGENLAAPGADLNYSLLDTLQLTTTIAGLTTFPEAGSSSFGLGDIDTSFKWQFLTEQEDRAWPGISLTPHLLVPTGSVRRHLGGGSYQFRLPIQIGKTFGDFFVFGEAGYEWALSEEGSDQILYGLCAQRQIKRWIIGAEINGIHNAGNASQRLLVANLGVIYTLSPSIELQGLLGRSLLNDRFGGPKFIGGIFMKFSI